MKILCCQLDIIWENKPANYAKVQKLLAEAKPPAGSLVVLPEMFATGFSMNAEALAEPVGLSGPTTAFLARTAREFGIWLIGGVIASSGQGRPRNQSVIVSPQGEEIARYSK